MPSDRDVLILSYLPHGPCGVTADVIALDAFGTIGDSQRQKVQRSIYRMKQAGVGILSRFIRGKKEFWINPAHHGYVDFIVSRGWERVCETQ